MSAVSRLRKKLAAWWQRREAVPGGDVNWAVREQVRQNMAHLRRLEDELEAERAARAALTRRLDDVTAGFAGAFRTVGRPVPDYVSDGTPTQPIHLRVV